MAKFDKLRESQHKADCFGVRRQRLGHVSVQAKKVC
ncbi:hypothetical protein GYH30_055951 [Glycine max]|nr:hypothetical protein GYH30_055951 [Glycine max]